MKTMLILYALYLFVIFRLRDVPAAEIRGPDDL
jgi:hypothetical protein